MSIFLKALAVWLLLAAMAVMNGILRDLILAPLLGAQPALPLSGVILAMLIFTVTFLVIPFFGRLKNSTSIMIGLLWVGITLLFEFSFGHYSAGKSWREIARVFNLTNGDLFSLALLVTAVSPWLAAKLRQKV
jgi:hypothetical protein